MTKSGALHHTGVRKPSGNITNSIDMTLDEKYFEALKTMQKIRDLINTYKKWTDVESTILEIQTELDLLKERTK